MRCAFAAQRRARGSRRRRGSHTRWIPSHALSRDCLRGCEAAGLWSAALPRYRRRLGGGRPCGASLQVTAACLHESDFSLLKTASITLLYYSYYVRPFASRVCHEFAHDARSTSPLRPRRRREGGWRVYSHHRTGPVTCTIFDLPIVLSGHRPRRSTGSTLGASPSRAGGAPRMSHPMNSERAFALLHERLRRILRACHSRARAALWRLSGVRQGP